MDLVQLSDFTETELREVNTCAVDDDSLARRPEPTSGLHGEDIASLQVDIERMAAAVLTRNITVGAVMHVRLRNDGTIVDSEPRREFRIIAGRKDTSSEVHIDLVDTALGNFSVVDGPNVLKTAVKLPDLPNKI